MNCLVWKTKRETFVCNSSKLSNPICKTFRKKFSESSLWNSNCYSWSFSPPPSNRWLFYSIMCGTISLLTAKPSLLIIWRRWPPRLPSSSPPPPLPSPPTLPRYTVHISVDEIDIRILFLVSSIFSYHTVQYSTYMYCRILLIIFKFVQSFSQNRISIFSVSFVSFHSIIY